MNKRTNNSLSESLTAAITKSIDKIQLAEKLDANVVRGDNYNSIPDGIVAQAKEKVKKMKLAKGSEYEPAMTKVLSDMGYEMNRSGKYVKEAALDPVDPVALKKKFADRKDKDIDNDGDSDSSDEYLHKRRKAVSKAIAKEETELDEAKNDYTVNHKTFSSAVQHATSQVEKRGYTVDEEDYDRKVAMGPRKPTTGKTNTYTIDLMKDGKETKRKLQMQVYYDQGRYELNMYIS